jgi:hypothetical protein
MTTRSHMPVDSATIRLYHVSQVRNHNYLWAGAHPEAINNLCLISKRVLTFSLFHSAPVGSNKYRGFLWGYSGRGAKLAIHLLTVLKLQTHADAPLLAQWSRS